MAARRAVRRVSGQSCVTLTVVDVLVLFRR